MKFRKMRQTIKKIKVENVVFNNIFGLIRFRTMLLASISICFGGKESNGDVLKSVTQTRLPDLKTRVPPGLPPAWSMAIKKSPLFLGAANFQPQFTYMSAISAEKIHKQMLASKYVCLKMLVTKYVGLKIINHWHQNLNHWPQNISHWPHFW